ncbi:hypothetical protein L1857_08805 [Amycolatopsis thermalba]|uniref:Uncharacterized protein n=1 Tax=Amycolatopsis thermalba TaxID=944492 RepID=A0ABY4NS66_9PSEU|nr:hypothetical protein [Amycolatopsis thermalba]UQS22909.1 hypothetical protein L1857_08805 [Amycolatopsis thermalba]
MAQPYPAPAPRRRWPLVMVALVVGLVVGAGAVGLVWIGSGPDAAGSDAEAACAAVARTTALDPQTQYAGFQRWGAAAQLAAAAAEQEPRYRTLADALQAPVDIVMRSFAAAGPEFDAAVARARSACADLQG